MLTLNSPELNAFSRQRDRQFGEQQFSSVAPGFFYREDLRRTISAMLLVVARRRPSPGSKSPDIAAGKGVAQDQAGPDWCLEQPYFMDEQRLVYIEIAPAETW